MFSSILLSDALNLDLGPYSPSVSEVVLHLSISSDLDLSIAIRKGIGSCIAHHPIHNVVSYNHLSPLYQTFISKLATECIPKPVSEDLTHP